MPLNQWQSQSPCCRRSQLRHTLAQHETTLKERVADEQQPAALTDVSPSYLQYMSTTSLAQGRPTKILHGGFSYEDWVGLKTLFTKAVRLYNGSDRFTSALARTGEN